MKKVGLLALTILLMTGCGAKTTKVELKCADDKKEIELKEGSKFECELLSTKYEFTVKSMDDDKFEIEANDSGLFKVREDGSISLLDKVTEFTIEKGKENILSTQTEDATGEMEIIWK